MHDGQRRQQERQNHGASALSRELKEDAAQTISHERKMISWMQQAYEDCKQSGGLDDLPGKGKPLNLENGDVLNSILKNANYLPQWLELQHEIRDDINLLIEADAKHTDGLPSPGNDNEYKAIQVKVDSINLKIKKYNTLVPSVHLQKGFITLDNAAEKYERWQ